MQDRVSPLDLGRNSNLVIARLSDEFTPIRSKSPLQAEEQEGDLSPPEVQENPLLFRQKSKLGDKSPDKIGRRLSSSDSMQVDFKVIVDQAALRSLAKEEELLGIGYSFGFTGFNQDVQKAAGTVRVETKQCLLAHLPPGDLYYVMEKHKNKKKEKMLQIVRSLPYFKGVTRNRAMQISGFLEKHKPCINQVLIKQGDPIKQDLIIIVHKGEFRVTKQVQDTQLAHPISQTTLVHNNLID